jgi:hypothetical protein
MRMPSAWGLWPNMDSRLRGNDGAGAGSHPAHKPVIPNAPMKPLIPAQAGIHAGRELRSSRTQSTAQAARWIPASAGMTKGSEASRPQAVSFGLPATLSTAKSTTLSPSTKPVIPAQAGIHAGRGLWPSRAQSAPQVARWIPASAGMTTPAISSCLHAVIPASAGMTKEREASNLHAVIPAQAGIHAGRGLRPTRAQSTAQTARWISAC